MSDAETFFGLESQEGQISAEAVEAFKEQMRKNAQAIKALQKAEKKQKKKEDKLAKMFHTFLQDPAKQHLVQLVTRLLQLNIPAVFVLSLILLGNESLQQQSGVNLKLATDEDNDDSVDSIGFESFPEKQLITVNQIFDSGQSTLPQTIKFSIDLWAKNIFEAARSQPYRILQTVLDLEKQIKPPVYELAAAVLGDYLTANTISNEQTKLIDFSRTMLSGILRTVEESIEQLKLKEADEYEGQV